jgi:hypothetical protein
MDWALWQVMDRLNGIKKLLEDQAQISSNGMLQENQGVLGFAKYTSHAVDAEVLHHGGAKMDGPL